MTIETVMKALDGVEKSLADMATKADNQAKENGKASSDTATALDNIGTKQRELADRLVAIE